MTARNPWQRRVVDFAFGARCWQVPVAGTPSRLRQSILPVRSPKNLPAFTVAPAHQATHKGGLLATRPQQNAPKNLDISRTAARF
jgi:hypothetical protein